MISTSPRPPTVRPHSLSSSQVLDILCMEAGVPRRTIDTAGRVPGVYPGVHPNLKALPAHTSAKFNARFRPLALGSCHPRRNANYTYAQPGRWHLRAKHPSASCANSAGPVQKKTHKISITRFVESAVTGNLRTQYKIKISWARFGGASVYRTRRYIPLCLQVDSACLILQGSSISNQCIYVLNVDRAPANRRNVDTVYLSCCLAGYCWRAVPILQGKMNLLLNAPSRRQIASARQQGINGRIAAQTSFSSS